MSRTLGVSYRPAFGRFLDKLKERVDSFEVIVPGFDPPAIGFLANTHPVSLHCLDLSLGAAEPLPDRKHVSRILESASPGEWVSDHLSATRIRDAELANFMTLPFDEESADRVAASVRDLKTESGGVGFALENVCYFFKWPPHREHALWSEARFTREVLRRSRAAFLLDVNNLYINAVNHRYDPYRFIDELADLPMAYLHVSGYSGAGSEFLVDSHDRRVSPEVWDLARYALRHTDARGLVLERDDPTIQETELLDELALARNLVL